MKSAAAAAAAVAVVVLLAAGCMPPPNPRAVMTRDDADGGGAFALYQEDDVEPSEHIARKDAERQMAARCAPRGYKITSRDQYDTGHTVVVNYGFGVSAGQRILVNQLHFVCVDKVAP